MLTRGFRKDLGRLASDPPLYSFELVEARRDGARISIDAKESNQTNCTFVPAAVGAANGWKQVKYSVD